MMKKNITYFLLFVFFVLFRFSLISQNLVPNPSFEQFDTCPYNNSQVYFSTGWHSYGNSPDYFNSCTSDPAQIGVPSNMGGFQTPPTSGQNAYAGMMCYNNITNASYREFIGRKISSPLTIGVKYNVNMKVNLADISNYAIDKLGALFSTISYNVDSICPQPCAMPISNYPNFAHVYSSGIISDKVNWVNITGSFTADSVYQYIDIGVFFDTLNTNPIYIGGGTFDGAYYYVDDIVLIPDSVAGIHDTFNEHEIIISPNPFSDFTIVTIAGNDMLDIKVLLFDVLGRNIETRKTISINKHGAKIIIEKNNLQTGIYYLQLQLNQLFYSQKLIITN